MRFRVVTYNIHKGIGNDRKYRLERIVQTLGHYEPDVALLQEVDEGVPRSHHHRQAELLAEALDAPYVAYQKNVTLKRGHYGNAILSRFPITEKENVDLTVPLKKRRRAIVVRCELHFDGHVRSLIVANIHLGLAGYERHIQLRRLLKDQSVTGHPRLPIVIGGDYNDVWASLGKNVMLPAGYRSVAGNIRTFPSALALRPLDRIFYKGTLEATNAFAAHTKLAREASDHLPLVADFHLHE